MKKSKIIKSFVCLALTGSLLAGCSGSGSGSSGNNSGSSSGGNSGSSSSGETVGNLSSEAGNLNLEGFPIVNDQITLTVFGQQGPVHSKWDDMDMWKEYQEMTNIKLDFTNVLPAEGFGEKKSLMWADGSYPDIFIRSFLSNQEIVKYGSMGVLAPLEELIPVYAPNMQSLIDENPAILSRITAPDGHIYSLPAIFTVNAARCSKFWINTEWLDQVEKDVPETLDEFEDVLRAFKDICANDQYPMGADTLETVVRRMAGVWGHQIQFGSFLDVIDGKVSTYMTDDDLKEILQWINKIYTEGLIDQEIFTQEYAKYTAKMAGKQMGFFFNQADDTFDSSTFIGISPFKGKSDVQYAEAQPIARDNGVFAISADCENIEAALRWIDYFYGWEGSVLMRYGVEGKNMYWDDDGMPRYADGILDSPEGSGTEIAKFTIWPGGGAPQMVNNDNCEAIASQATLDAEVALNPYFPENIYSEPLLTDEVSDRLSVLWTDIDNYKKQCWAKFVIGELNFDSDWNTYVETMGQIGIDEWVAIYQDAFDNIS